MQNKDIATLTTAVINFEELKNINRGDGQWKAIDFPLRKFRA